MNAQQTWQATLAQLQLQMTHATFNTWVKNAQLIKRDKTTYIIGVKNTYAKDWLENRLESTIKRTLSSTAGSPVELQFVVLPYDHAHAESNGNGAMTIDSHDQDWLPEEDSSGDDDENQDKKPALDTSSSNGDGQMGASIKLKPNYTFDRFVVGSSNRLAHAAALAVADGAGNAYNPLFLYGGVGLGKTHLLQAISHGAHEDNKRVIYVSSETFTNDFINAIRRQTTDRFREHYRNADFLLIDDIQFLAGKESTQEEFFHTFNDIHASGGQIVLSSDRLPRAIPTLEDRLSSRFEWGLLADIQPPDLETRLAILRFKADEIGVQVPYDVMEFIARRAQNNIRELEGALNKVVANAALMKEPIDLELAKHALQNLVNRRASITVEMIIEVVAEFFDVTVEDLCGNGRSKRIAGPRQMVMYLSREETKASLPQIGEALGGRDHTTIIYGYDKVNKKVEQDEQTRRDAMQIREILYQRAS